MRKYNQLNDVVLSCIVWKWGNLPGWEGPNHEHYRHWAKKSVHLHKWSFLYLEFWLEFSEVSTKFIRLGFLLLCVPFILQIDWSCWLQIKSHPIIWWLLNEVSGQLCTIIIHQKKNSVSLLQAIDLGSWAVSAASRADFEPSRPFF